MGPGFHSRHGEPAFAGRVVGSPLVSRSTFNGSMSTEVLDFGTGSDMAMTSVADPMVRDYSSLRLTLGGPSTDHDVEDGLIEQLVLSFEMLPGVGFNIYAHAPSGTWGRYNVQWVCTYF